MGLVTMKSILLMAQKNKYAVGAFTFWSLDAAKAIIDAANRAQMPVILQTGPLEANYAGLQELADIARMAVRYATVPVALNLDHGDTVEIAEQAINCGFTSVMIDASRFAFDENVRMTQEVVQMAALKGVTVEAELGKIGGVEGLLNTNDGDALQTDPDEAADFISKTGIDALAVAIGTAHGLYTCVPKINIELLKHIAAQTTIPLVLHGGSGTPDAKVLEAIQCGIAKVNICTEFIAAMGKAFTLCQTADGYRYNVPSLFKPARDAGGELAYKKIVFFSNGQAK